MPPLVSVLMTAYNRQSFIAEAIESVLASSYKNFELIICDDCSTDNTLAISKTYAVRDERVKVYSNPERLGQFPNRNRCSEYAKGKYIKYLDSDDIIMPDGLQYCVTEMEKFPDAAMGIFNSHAKGNMETFYMQPSESMQRHFFKEDLLFAGPSATIIRRTFFEESGRFDTRFGVPSDNYFNVRLAAYYPVIMLGKPFFTYRAHEGQEINNSRDYVVYGYLYFKELLTNVNLPLPAEKIDYLYRKMNKRHTLTLIRYWRQTKNFKDIKKIVKQTGVTYTGMLLSLFK